MRLAFTNRTRVLTFEDLELGQPFVTGKGELEDIQVVWVKINDNQARSLGTGSNANFTETFEVRPVNITAAELELI